MHSFHLILLSGLPFEVSKSIVIDNPVSSVLEKVDTFLATYQPSEEPNNCASTQPNTEGYEAGSEKLSCDVPPERIWVKTEVKGRSVVPEGPDDTSSKWT